VGLVAFASRREEFDWGREGSSAVVALISSGVLEAEENERVSARSGEGETRERRREREETNVVLAIRASSLDESISQEPAGRSEIISDVEIAT